LATLEAIHGDFKAWVAVNRFSGWGFMSCRMKVLADRVISERVTTPHQYIPIARFNTFWWNISPIAIVEFDMSVCDLAQHFRLIISLKWLITTQSVQLDKFECIVTNGYMNPYNVYVITLQGGGQWLNSYPNIIQCSTGQTYPIAHKSTGFPYPLRSKTSGATHI
jgi:hypothetical protein